MLIVSRGVKSNANSKSLLLPCCRTLSSAKPIICLKAHSRPKKRNIRNHRRIVYPVMVIRLLLVSIGT